MYRRLAAFPRLQGDKLVHLLSTKSTVAQHPEAQHKHAETN